jgi:hypothetical protein
MPHWWIPTRDDEGNPICFICESPVVRPGEACSRECYAHFLVAVAQQPGMIEMENLLDLQEMAWYGEGSPA